jgi:hypothetical protein
MTARVIGSRELVDPLAPAAIGERVERRVHGAFDDRVELLERRAPERRFEQRTADLEVLRFVAGVEGRTRRPALLRVQPRDLGVALLALEVLPGGVRVPGEPDLPHRLGRDRVREPFGVHQDGTYVVVAGKDVHAGRGVLPHGPLVAQCAVGPVRAVVGGPVEEVDGGIGRVCCMGHGSAPLLGVADQPFREPVQSSIATTSAWAGRTFSISTRCTSSSGSAQPSDNTTRP